MLSEEYFQPHHIYIASDSEIKEGDWCICEYSDGGVSVNTYKDLSGINKYKIVLTTDQDLIKDGVQAIDDEFLEWFVKNPSCEYVEVSEDYFKPSNMVYGHDTEPYKIIIPKEEQKQDLPQIGTIEFVNMCESIFGGKPKQEQDRNKFSEEDMLLAFETGRNFQLTGENNFKELIEQLKK
jgi:hypothetical protein